MGDTWMLTILDIVGCFIVYFIIKSSSVLSSLCKYIYDTSYQNFSLKQPFFSLVPPLVACLLVVSSLTRPSARAYQIYACANYTSEPHPLFGRMRMRICTRGAGGDSQQRVHSGRF